MAIMVLLKFLSLCFLFLLELIKFYNKQEKSVRPVHFLTSIKFCLRKSIVFNILKKQI